MSSIVKKMQSKPDFYAMKGVTEEQIKQAEKALGLLFSDEYREYVAAFGIASFDGHELTGICAFPRLDVVSVTNEERNCNPTIPPNYYVVEQAHIDGIVVWQSSTGEVYQTMPNAPTIKLCASLCEYLEL